MKGKNERREAKFKCDRGNENHDAGTGINHQGNHAHSSNSTIDSKLKITNKKTKERRANKKI